MNIERKEEAENNHKLRFSKYLGLYLSKFHQEKYKLFGEEPRYDVLWPFNFIWFVITNLLMSLWRGLFRKV